MWDSRKAKAGIFVELEGMQTDRAQQCPSRDPRSGHWFTSQAHVNGSHEDCWVYEHDAKGKKLKLMKLWKAGHGTTISVLDRGAGLGILINWSGHGLVWVPYRSGEFAFTATKAGSRTVPPAGAVPIFRNIAGNSGTVYLDHPNGLLTMRRVSGSQHTFRQYKLPELLAGMAVQVGRDVGPMTRQAAKFPFQGFGAHADQIFTLHGYGHPGQKRRIRSYSSERGSAVLYDDDPRRLSSDWTVQEPESLIFVDGQMVLGIAGRNKSTGNRRRHLLVRVAAEVTSTQTQLQVLNARYGPITKMSLVAFEKARTARYPSRYVAAAQGWLKLTVDCTWSDGDQAAFDAWRQRTWTTWTPEECSGAAGMTSMTRLAADGQRGLARPLSVVST
jgi:hypothetical protein